MNACLSQGRVPELWEAGEIIALYKKHNPSKPENYRPISLLNTAYKLYAALLCTRLQIGLRDRTRPNQYGFQADKSTADAIHIIRRIQDLFKYHHDDPLYLCFLDWEKAFDRVSPEALVIALRLSLIHI